MTFSVLLPVLLVLFLRSSPIRSSNAASHSDQNLSFNPQPSSIRVDNNSKNSNSFVGDDDDIKSLCVSMFFCPHVFRLESQSGTDLVVDLATICEASQCTHHLQTRIHRQHLRCLHQGEESFQGDLHDDREYVDTRRVEGFCITTVGQNNAARFHAPTVESLEERLTEFCTQHGIGMSGGQVDMLREYVHKQCFAAPSVTQPRRRSVMSSSTTASSPSARRTQKVVNSAATLQRVLTAMTRHRTHIGSNGLLLLPRYKLALCVPPKSGVVSVLFVLLAILGNAPEDMCGCGLEKFGCLGIEGLRNYGLPMYRGMVYANDDVRFGGSAGRGSRLVQQAFTDPAWQTVMVVRDPWRRAVSAFHEDNGYQGWVDLGAINKTSTSQDRAKNSPQKRRAAMLAYLQRAEKFNHAMPASSFCGLQEGLRFDHYVDIDKGLGGLAGIFAETSPPVPREFLTTGWEKCTEGGAASILGARLHTSHTWGEGRRQLDEVYCRPALVRAAMRHFREDYEVLAGLAGFSLLPRCLGDAGALALLAGDELQDEQEQEVQW